MNKMNVILRKCKSLSKQLSRSSSYSSLRSKSTKEEDLWDGTMTANDEVVVYVGSSRRRYTINSKLLDHPLLNALIDHSKLISDSKISVRCEVVLFDHILWMLENSDPQVDADDATLQELAQLYAY